MYYDVHHTAMFILVLTSYPQIGAHSCRGDNIVTLIVGYSWLSRKRHATNQETAFISYPLSIPCRGFRYISVVQIHGEVPLLFI